MIADDAPSRILTNEQIADTAYLKKTSLYELAVKCGISEPSALVERLLQMTDSDVRMEGKKKGMEQYV